MKKRWLRFCPTPNTEFNHTDNSPLNISEINFTANSVTDQAMPTISIKDLKSAELTWWDWTVFLLHTAAEVEHALMVQYLYALYSLGEPPFRGSKVPINAEELVRRWRSNLLTISQQEMAHFATVQNLLRFIGGPLNFEREDFPFRNFLYPFKFHLEPLSKTSLAKYVSAEMPKSTDDPSLIQQIVCRATGYNEELPMNRVGELYEQLISLFKSHDKILDQNLRPDTAVKLQAKSNDWFGFGRLLVKQISSREDALRALEEISEQGEGLRKPSGNESLSDSSHFEIFLRMYKEYPETDKEIAEIDWIPTRPVPFNPTTSPHDSVNSASDNSRITNDLSLLWAHLFNVRYRMLLMYLFHAFELEGPMIVNGEKTIRGYLRDWTFNEMRGQSSSRLSGLSGLARMLVSLPLRGNGLANDEQIELVSAPPFELPYTLALPDRNEDRWQLHLSLISTSSELIKEIRNKSGDDQILVELLNLDSEVELIMKSKNNHS